MRSHQKDILNQIISHLNTQNYENSYNQIKFHCNMWKQIESWKLISKSWKQIELLIKKWPKFLIIYWQKV